MNNVIVSSSDITTATQVNISKQSNRRRPVRLQPTRTLFKRLTILTLGLLSLALAIQTTDSREWAPSRRSLGASRRPNAHLRLVRNYDDIETDDEDVKPSPEPSNSEKNDDDNDDEEAKAGKSRAKELSFKYEDFEKFFTTKGPVANPNSGIEKGSETELPKEPIEVPGGKSDIISGENGENSGIVKHSDNPAAKAEKGTAVDEDPKADEDGDDGADDKSVSSKAAIDESGNDNKEAGGEDGNHDEKSDDTDNDSNEKYDETSESSPTPEPEADLAHDESADNTGATTTTKPTNEPHQSYSSTLRPNESSKRNSTLIKSTKRPKNATEAILSVDKSTKANLNKVDRGIAELGAKSEKLASRKNTSIVINGRKFDQVETIECIDQRFYKMLMDDLKLINPSLQRDYYGTYYDNEYAKAVSAIVDLPQVKGKEPAGEKPSSSKSVTDIVDDIRRFWKETHDTYVGNRVSLGPEFASRTSFGSITVMKRLKRASTSSSASKSVPKHKAALANYKYLLSRLEQLKLMLMNGEEALIVLNNRVKKLNEVPTEEELHGALCGCITSRGGRAALSAMNEIFVDKNSAKLMSNPEQGKERGRDAARDVAEFCAFWYGDTMRSEAVQKEKQIKRLVLSVAKSNERRAKTIEGYKNKTKQKRKKKLITKKKTTKITETTLTTRGNVTKREVHTKVVTQIVQMTELWMPELSKWIKSTLDVKSQNVTEDGKPVVEILPTNGSSASSAARTRRNADSSNNGFFSTPFDNPNTYADIDGSAGDLSMSGSGSGFGSRVHLRRRRQAPTTSTSTTPPRRSSRKTGRRTTRTTPAAAAAINPARMSTASPSSSPSPSKMHIHPKVTPSPEPSPSPTSSDAKPDFESRVSNRTSVCAQHGFAELISIGFDQNSLMHETNTIKRDDKYIVAFREAFISSFPAYWREMRDHWSRSMATDGGKGDDEAASADSNATMADKMGHNKGRSVDEEIDDSMGDGGGAYERGARLGFTIGKFIGDKSANQWPDPAELNTFTYDSLFLAGVGHGHTEEDSRLLERRIVSETAKRVAFGEASRQAFARTLHSSYLNGAFIVPIWGVLHAQRAIAAQGAKEGAKAGFDASSRAIKEFVPKATKFFLDHQHQRALAAPYKPAKRGSHPGDKWAGLKEQIDQVKREGELSKNISELAIDCGQKSGSVMGALMGLMVAPEAFETYMRIRGSLEALENEFNQFKLGAMRGYELGETWAHLNYTVSMNRNLQAMKSQMGSTAHLGGEAEIQDSHDSGGGNQTAGSSKQKQLREKEDKISSSSLFESKLDGVSNDTNTNNIFQFMVLNYGTHLVANHSRKHMLKFRSVSMDENLLRDMKIQSGDLIADTGNVSLSSSDGPDDDDDEEGELFEAGGRYAGQLDGKFNSIDNKRKIPLKFNIIDLGPLLEMEDEIESTTRGSSHNSSLETTPLTTSLAKIGKVFMKFSVARRKRHQEQDDVARFLNGGPNGFDSGDGYLCGTFSKLTSRLANGSSVQISDSSAQEEDDFSTEVTILDELFERIEGAPLKMGTVSLVEKVMSMTTSAPKRTDSIAAADTTLRPSILEPKSTTRTPKSPINIQNNATTSPPEAAIEQQDKGSGEEETDETPTTEMPEVSGASSTASPTDTTTSRARDDESADDENTSTTRQPQVDKPADDSGANDNEDNSSPTTSGPQVTGRPSDGSPSNSSSQASDADEKTSVSTSSSEPEESEQVHEDIQEVD